MMAIIPLLLGTFPLHMNKNFLTFPVGRINHKIHSFLPPVQVTAIMCNLPINNDRVPCDDPSNNLNINSRDRMDSFRAGKQELEITAAEQGVLLAPGSIDPFDAGKQGGIDGKTALVGIEHIIQ